MFRQEIGSFDFSRVRLCCKQVITQTDRAGQGGLIFQHRLQQRDQQLKATIGQHSKILGIEAFSQRAVGSNDVLHRQEGVQQAH